MLAGMGEMGTRLPGWFEKGLVWRNYSLYIITCAVYLYRS
jgi:hypothetical protein